MKFPVLLKHKGNQATFIVLASSETSATVIKSCNPIYSVGEHLVNGFTFTNEALWEELKGEVVLENGYLTSFGYRYV